MVEYIVAAWLTSCAAGKIDYFCISLPPGKTFEMWKAIRPPFTFENGNPGENWCVVNASEQPDAWANLTFKSGKTVIELGPGMSPCNTAPKGDPIS